MEGSMSQIPVFVFPNALKFYLGARHTHKQLLTLYNPYDFPVRFKVLSTAPNKYSVIDPDGSIGPRACVDIVVRHTVPILSNCNVSDKFRISMQDHSTKKVLGKRDIEARLLQGEPDNISNDGDFQALGIGDKHPEDQRTTPYPMHSYRTPYHQNNTLIYMSVLAMAICSIALLWPTQSDPLVENYFIPKYLYITNTIKLVFAYVLGIVTMVILKQ
ncbi:motile sperm domain-containing protein 1-like [Atheta coriaria]|uniref:motile sperm domain-containing protein 1-like n=1 Tax=Dalotia coriaria TaxID=877792 RepID=UPI0031F39653